MFSEFIQEARKTQRFHKFLASNDPGPLPVASTPGRTPPSNMSARPPFEAAPPPYTGEVTIPSALIRHGILATDVPQWTWSNAQCREWLFVVYTSLLNLGIEESRDVAEAFVGFGPELYMMRLDEWDKLVGKDRARSVYALLLSRRHEDGAAPRSIQFQHGGSNENSNRKNSKGNQKLKKNKWK